MTLKPDAPAASYNRPMPAKLIVRLDNGEEFEASRADLEKFGLTDRAALLNNLRRFITLPLGKSRAHKSGQGFELAPILESINLLEHAPSEFSTHKQPELQSRILSLEDAAFEMRRSGRGF